MLAELTFWEWAQRQGYSMVQLAAKLGYSPEHLSRLKNGKVPITVEFSARCVLAFGDCARQFFLSVMPVATDTTSCEADR
jgi:plasmid maintenance system antidote protein VapI